MYLGKEHQRSPPNPAATPKATHTLPQEARTEEGREAGQEAGLGAVVLGWGVEGHAPAPWDSGTAWVNVSEAFNAGPGAECVGCPRADKSTAAPSKRE